MGSLGLRLGLGLGLGFRTGLRTCEKSWCTVLSTAAQYCCGEAVGEIEISVQPCSLRAIHRYLV